MFTKRISSFLNELLNRGYEINVSNEEISKEEREFNEGKLIIKAKDELLKKEYIIKISVMDEKECVYKLIPVTDKKRIEDNYWITHCMSLKKDRDLYNFEYEYKFVNNDLNLKFKLYEFKDMEDDNFFDDKDTIIAEENEIINVKNILSVLKNNFVIEQLQFIK